MEAGIVGLRMDTNTSTVYCQLHDSYVVTADAVCSITYGYLPGSCETYSDSSIPTIGRPGVNLTIPLSQNMILDNIAQFCYTVFLKYGLTKMKITGNFTTGTIILEVYT